MSDKTITAKIIKELIAPKDTSEVSSEKVLVWVQMVEVLRAKKAVLENIKRYK